MSAAGTNRLKIKHLSSFRAKIDIECIRFSYFVVAQNYRFMVDMRLYEASFSRR